MIKKKNISKIDIETWGNYIKNPTDITDKENYQKSVNFDNYRFKYDLHGYTLIDANIKVKELILSSVKKNYKEILLITGKGIHSNIDADVYVSKDLSTLKHSVPEFIKSDLDISTYVLSVSNADKKDGGEGAIIIKLKNL